MQVDRIGKYLFYEGNVDLSCGAYRTNYKLQLEASCYSKQSRSVVHNITEFLSRYEYRRFQVIGYWITMYQDVHESTMIPGNATIQEVDKWRAEQERHDRICGTVRRELDRARDDFIHYLAAIADDSDDDDEFEWGGSDNGSEEDFTEE